MSKITILSLWSLVNRVMGSNQNMVSLNFLVFHQNKITEFIIWILEMIDYTKEKLAGNVSPAYKKSVVVSFSPHSTNCYEMYLAKKYFSSTHQFIKLKLGSRTIWFYWKFAILLQDWLLLLFLRDVCHFLTISVAFAKQVWSLPEYSQMVVKLV